MARLYSNENFPRQAVEALRALGHDVCTTLEAGQANRCISDDAVLAFASREGRAVVTLNRRDFRRLHRRRPEHAGIIVCTEDPDHEALAARISSGLAEAPMIGRLLSITREG